MRSRPSRLSSMWQDLKAWCFHSLTVAWGYTKILGGVVLYSAHELVDTAGNVITSPEVKSALSAMNFPAYVGLGLAVLGVITVSVRLRTVTQPTNENNQVIETHVSMAPNRRTNRPRTA